MPAAGAAFKTPPSQPFLAVISVPPPSVVCRAAGGAVVIALSKNSRKSALAGGFSLALQPISYPAGQHTNAPETGRDGGASACLLIGF